MTAVQEERTTRSPWSCAPFRWLLAGTTVKSLGSGIAPVALAFGVIDLGGSATDLGVVVGLFALAEVVAIMYGGVLGDRLPRTVMIQGTTAAAGLAQGVAAASLIGDWSSIPLLAAVGVVMGAVSALGTPSSQALTPQTVPAELLAVAITWRRLGLNVAQIIGYGVAGMLVALLGSGWCLALDAATYAVAAGCFALIRVAPAAAPDETALLSQVRAGLAEVLRHTWLWLLILQALLYHLFYGGAQGVLGPLVVEEGFSRAAWGWALAAMMTGFAVGGLVSLRWRPRRLLYVGTAFLALTACFPAAMAFSESLPVLLGGALLHGFGLEIFSVAWDLAIQQNVAPDKLARVYAFDMVGSFVARPVGLALTGPVAEVVGYRSWLAVVAAVMVGAALLALLVPDVRRLERR